MYHLHTNSKIVAFNKPFITEVHRYPYNYQPLQKGRLVPQVVFQPGNFLSALPYGSLIGNSLISIHELLEFKQPVVLVFFSAKAYNDKIFAELESLKLDVDVMGGKLLVVSNSFSRQIKTFVANNNITVYYDAENVLAEAFGLYSYNNPLHNWLSGIDDPLTVLPAFYVIDPGKRVAFDLIDFDIKIFEKEGLLKMAFIRELLSAVHHSFRQFQKQSWPKRITL
ncbi:MAG: redoxin domain-containing protein [Sphingobacteriia bacterium]|nr:redoxin domain-containing protein [Sphingobacteriia bacterium]